MKTRILTLVAALAFGIATAHAAGEKPAAACPAAKQTCEKSACAEKPAADKAKAACCATADKAACCATKDKAACAKAAGDCPKCAAGKTNAAAGQTCPVSGEKLGGMGEPFTYTHKQDGKPDRTITFCCKMCVKSFEKNPAKYLSKLDAE